MSNLPWPVFLSILSGPLLYKVETMQGPMEWEVVGEISTFALASMFADALLRSGSIGVRIVRAGDGAVCWSVLR